MKLWVFRNEPGTGSYCFCTKEPEPIYGDDMRRVVYTSYGELVGCMPKLTFEALFPALKFGGGSYRRIQVDDIVDVELEITGYTLIQVGEEDEGSRPTKTKQTP